MGDEGESGEELWVRDTVAQDNRAAIAEAMAVVRKRLLENPVTNIPELRISLRQQKSPTRHLGANGMALSREEHGLCGMGGWPGLRLFSRSQWRDRGRFTRPSPLPLPAN